MDKEARGWRAFSLWHLNNNHGDTSEIKIGWFESWEGNNSDTLVSTYRYTILYDHLTSKDMVIGHEAATYLAKFGDD